MGNFAHGRPYHGAETVSCNEEGEAECGFDLADAEGLDDVFYAGAVYGRTDVDGEGQEADLEGDENLFEGRPIYRVLSLLIRPHFRRLGQDVHTSGSLSPYQVTIVTSRPFSGSIT